MIGNRISGIYGSSGSSLLNRNQEDRFERVSGRNRSIFNRGFFPSGSNRHLHVRPHPPMLQILLFQFPSSCFYSALHPPLSLYLFLPPSPLNHEWFDIHRRPITAQDTSWLPLFSTNSPTSFSLPADPSFAHRSPPL